MKNWTKFASLWSILVVVKVECNSTECDVIGREALRDLSDALVLIPGSEVIISCCGDVSVSGVRTVQGTCTGLHESDSEQITTKNSGLPASTNHRADPVDSLETNQLEGDFTLQDVALRTVDEAGSDWSELDHLSQWLLNDQPMQGMGSMAGDLRIPSFGLNDAGNYSCYRAGRRMSTVRLHLANSTERPTLTCRWIGPSRKIRCDWKARQPVSPAPKCLLFLKTSCSSEPNKVYCCRYSALHSRCRCVIEPPALKEPRCTDSSYSYATLFVRSPLGTGASQLLKFTPASVLKPDPPSGVSVSAVEGRERTLQVSWSYPTSWKHDMIQLKFELRYKPEHGQMYQTELVNTESWTIKDALPSVRYTVQVRAREEHDEGDWSRWTSPHYAQAWTAPMQTDAPNTTDISEEPLILMVIPDPSTAPDSKDRPDQVDGLIWVSVIGCCVVVIMFILVFIQVIRHRTHFKSKVEKLCFPFPPPGDSLQTTSCQSKAQDCPPSNSPAQKPPDDPSPEHNATNQHVHFHNMSYFVTKTDTS